MTLLPGRGWGFDFFSWAGLLGTKGCMDRVEIAEVLREIGVMLELRGENAFKVRAYSSGGRALENLEENLGTLIAEKRLDRVPGIGRALAEKIERLFETGELPLHKELKASLPPGLFDMLEVPGLGPKKIKAIYGELGITTLDELAAACREGRVSALEGFGKKSEEKILAGIRNREAYAKRHLWWEAFQAAEPILAGLRGLSGVDRTEHAGSLRRRLETVGDLDFIVAADNPRPVMEWFTGQEAVAEVTAFGETKSSVRLEGGLQADLRVVPPDQFAFALHHFTGSKDHNVKMRQRALSLGFSLSEWGLIPEESKASRKEGRTRKPKSGAPEDPGAIRGEAELFAFLGLEEIPPELREGLDEIDAAEAGELPRLVEESDLRGAFHNHTSASDGRNSLMEMAQAAESLGWEYLGIADHSKASFQANGLNEERLARQLEEIRRFNSGGRSKVHIFAGVECDILPDGRMDLDDSILGELDYVVASVHSSFGKTEEEMTRRIIRAIEHPSVTMIGHLTGRLLLAREGYRVDHARIIDAAAANGVVLEINGHPRRLDMDWRYWKRAAAKGVMTSINPDAHDTAGLKFVQTGVWAARKGWLTKESVLNTRSLDEVARLIRAK